MAGVVILLISFIVPFLSKNRLFFLLPVFTIENLGWGFFDMAQFGKYPISSFSFLLIIVFFLFSQKRIRRIPRGVPMINIYYGFLFFIVLQFIVSLIKYGDPMNVLSGTVPYLYYFCFPLFILILLNEKQNNVDSFVKTVLFLTLFNGVLYVFDTLGGYDVLPSRAHETFDGGVVRVFFGFPSLIILVFVYCFFTIRNTWLTLFAAFVVGGCILAVLTRHLVIEVLLQFLVIFFISQRSASQKATLMIKVASGFAFLLIIFLNFQSGYFDALLGRFELAKDNRFEESNFALRWGMITGSFSYILSNDFLFGFGFLRNSQDYFGRNTVVRSIMGDTTWANWLMQLGIIGIVFLWRFLLSFLHYLYKSISNSGRRETRWAELYIFSQLLILPVFAVFTTDFQNPGPLLTFFWAYVIVKNYKLMLLNQLNRHGL